MDKQLSRSFIFTICFFFVQICNANPLLVNFQTSVQYEGGGTYPTKIQVDDINGDGHLDVLLAGDGQIHFLLGNGLGGLNKDNTLKPSLGSNEFITADFNHDGIRDIAVSQQTNVLAIANSLCGIKAGVLIFLGSGGETPRFNFK